MAWLTGWIRRKSKTFTGTSQTDYQMKFNIHQGSGTDGSPDNSHVYLNDHCDDNFDQVRFTRADGTTLLNYWIESIIGTSGNMTAVIWVKIADTSETTYIYYDSPGAPTISNGKNTFDAFDLTTFTLYNPDGILTVNSASKVSWSGNIYMSHSYLCYPISSRSDFSVDFEYGDSGAEHATIGFADSLNDMSHVTNGIYAVTETPGGNRGFYIERYTSGTNNWNSGGISYGGSNYYMRFTRSGNVITLHMFSDPARTIEISGSPVTYTDTGTPPVTYFYAISGKGFPSGVLIRAGYVQNVRVRKYVSPELIYGAWGTEELSIVCGPLSCNIIILEILSEQLSKQFPEYIDIELISKLDFKDNIK